MGGNPGGLKLRVDRDRDGVVDGPLARDLGLLHAVEGGGVVFVLHHVLGGIGGGVHALGLAINNAITVAIYPQLEAAGIPTHFIRQLSEREQLVKAVSIVPVEVIVRNVAAGSFSKRLGIEEGTPLPHPVIEYCYKSDALGDPLINTDTALSLGWATEPQLIRIRELALKVRGFLTPFFAQRGVRLIDFKLEFGTFVSGEVVLADEISPDTCRFWDAATNEKLDKDRFRRDLGGVENAYAEMLRRITT